MPTDTHDSDRDRDRDRDREERGGKSKGSSSSKTKDLSHVPCKFFKVGGCTAGSSCPFSHNTGEGGGQKETCTWFVKGNCKFGHKCALAHILPGQSATMDRKNKKLAQAAAAAEKPAGRSGTSSASGGGRVKRETSGNSAGANRLPLLAGGSTGPMRIAQGSGSRDGASGRGPMKAALSPSAPAPPIKDTDFASFASLEELDDVLPHSQPSSTRASVSNESDDKAPAEAKAKDQEAPAASEAAQEQQAQQEQAQPQQQSQQQQQQQQQQQPPADAPGSLSGTPISVGTGASRGANVDFGPIGSPPGYRVPSTQPLSPIGINGAFSPGTSPRNTHGNGVNIANNNNSHNNNGGSAANANAASGSLLSSSPFSSSSYPYNQHAGTGIAASLGSGLAMMGGRKGWGEGGDTMGQPNSFSGLLSAQLSSTRGGQRYDEPGSAGVGGGGFDDFAPSSLRTSRRPFGGFGGGMGSGIGMGREREGYRQDRQDSALDEADMEDFVPGSLTDLLTPEERLERSRRMSRSTSGQGPQAMKGEGAAPVSGLTSAMKSGAGGGGGGVGGLSQLANAEANIDAGGLSSNYANNASATNIGHRYSRSVPAPSLLGDLRSIWADPSIPALSSSPHRGTPGSVSGFANSRFGGGVAGAGGDPYASAAFANDDYGVGGVGIGGGGGGMSSSFGMGGGMSMSVGTTSSSIGAGNVNMSLSPSNASAAFLPGLHHHYLSAKQKQAQAQQAALGMGMGGGGGMGGGMGVGGRGGLGLGRNVTAPIGALPGAGGVSGGLGGLGAGGAGVGVGSGNPNSLANNYMNLGLPSSASSSSAFHTHTHGGTQTAYRAAPNPFDLTQTLPQNQRTTSGGGGSGISALGMAREKSGTGAGAGAGSTAGAYGNFSGMGGAMASGFADDPGFGWGGNTILSPSTRALQAHAPGQSLPQGLAAGYSRIHALPPLADIAASPPVGEGGSSGKELNVIDEDLDWPSVGKPAQGQGQGQGMHSGAQQQHHQQQQQQQQGGGGGSTGLEGMFSRLSYSAAASARGAPASPGPPGLTRNVSGSRYAPPGGQQQQQPLSPLARNDDDDLFGMDD